MSLRQQREINLLRDAVERLEARIAELVERIEALEQRRGPGRPRKDEVNAAA